MAEKAPEIGLGAPSSPGARDLDRARFAGGVVVIFLRGFIEPAENALGVLDPASTRRRDRARSFSPGEWNRSPAMRCRCCSRGSTGARRAALTALWRVSYVSFCDAQAPPAGWRPVQ
jgi:hypothetical protein